MGEWGKKYEQEKTVMAVIKHFRDLTVYKNSMEACMEIFTITKGFPTEERYSLTDQVRRSSRSVCANIAEAWRKRRYKAAFASKLSDSETEAAETQVWLEVSLNCGYLTESDFQRLDDVYDRIIAQLVRMMGEPEKWLIRKDGVTRPAYESSKEDGRGRR